MGSNKPVDRFEERVREIRESRPSPDRSSSISERVFHTDKDTGEVSIRDRNPKSEEK